MKYFFITFYLFLCIAEISSQPYTIKKLGLEKGLSNNYINDIVEDKKGYLWFATEEGLNKLEGNHFTSFYKKSGKVLNLTGNELNCLLDDPTEPILWIGTQRSGLNAFNYQTNQQIIYQHDKKNPNSICTNDITGIYPTSDGNLWITTYWQGIDYLDKKTGKFTHYNQTTIPELPSNTVWTLLDDNKGNLYIGHHAENGMSILSLKTKKVKNFTHDPNNKKTLPHNNVQCIFKDNTGNIWAGTGRGLALFNPNTEEFIWLGEKNPSLSHLVYDIQQFNENQLWVATELGGIAIIDLSKTLFNTAEEIHVIQAGNNEHNLNNFNISFSIQDYSLNERVEYAYMLKGLENSWYTVKDPNNVTFRNLPPGKYEFMIKTRIRNQEWSDEISSIEIIIAPPLWLSWWAKLLYVISGVGLLFTGLWAYKRKLNLEYLYESEKKSHEQEQELNDERLRFYTNITHELRTPLTLILGPLEDLVKSNTLSSKDHHRISVIHQSAVRLLNLINQILDFRKTETQNKRLCVTKGNLTSAVYETGLKYKELNNKPEIQILIEVEEENMVLFFDKEVITMILDNLISNALKYTEKGYIRIRAEWVTENGIRYAQLSVEDTGYGIGQDALAHIFERYYQESGEHQASGTGIGLALVKNLVKLHEGDIQVKSLPEIGTTFYLRLPAGNTYPQALHGEDIHTDKQDGKEEEPIEKQEVADKDKNARPIILVVEDNADIRDYIADSFTDLYEIKTAANGKEGLQIATDCIPDIIVSDIMMPVMNGVVMCQKLKADIRTSHIPVILLTAKDSITDKEEGYQAGADSYLTKPFSAGLLQSRISNLLTQRRLLSERFAIRPDKPKKQSMEEKRAIITESMNKLDKEFLDKITNTITEGLAAAENIDITVLSNVMCMSSSTLYRKVKALTGMSTNEYIRKIKMQLAEKYLLEGKYSISEIAFKVGINSNVYFRQCFKEEFGMSASDYLKQLTGKSIDEKVDE